jgi:Peptidase propeptide and YPEB domain
VIVALATVLVSTAVADFRGDFPGASVVESPAGGRLTHVSGFEARGFGDSPEAAARGFLAKYGVAFGIARGQELDVRSSPPKGVPGAVRFARRIGQLPLFDGDVVVGVDAASTVMLVNAADVPPVVEGRHRKSRTAAIRAARAAIPGREISGEPRTQRGWRAAGRTVRPVWRVDFVAEEPPGSFRCYVDAETGRVLLRTDRRATTLRSATR